jgi:hypothetical protein
MGYPSINTLLRIGISKEQCKEIRAILTGKVNPDEYCEEWINECYHRPGLHELKMYAINKVMHGFGVEYIPGGNNSKSPSIEYINMGDTYTTTICFVNGKYRVCSWGDIVERGEYN